MRSQRAAELMANWHTTRDLSALLVLADCLEEGGEVVLAAALRVRIRRRVRSGSGYGYGYGYGDGDQQR